jgi:hypothetical protein
MARWAALGRTASGTRAFLTEGDQIVAEAEGADESSALAGLGEVPQRLLRLGEGPASKLPTALKPDAPCTCPAMEQESPPDILGAWTRLRLLGLTRSHPNWDGVACLQEGDISHWVHLSAGEAVSCQSFLTPRLIAALGGAAQPCTDALEDSLSRPERLAAYLRRADVTGQAAAITGHLIGAELAAAKPYWLGQDVALIAAPGSAYATALAAQGLPHRGHDPDTLFAQGLAALGQ